jgi:addiction module HigA family antidote
MLKRELAARHMSANRLALDLGVPSGRITDILNGRRSITADTAVRLGRYFGNRPQFWLDLQSQHDVAVVERERGAEIMRRVRPADAA